MPKRRDTPPIPDANDYLQQLTQYYRLLQPKHRGCVLDFPLPKSPPLDDSEWEPLLKGGRNGIILLIIGIAWLPTLESAGIPQSKTDIIVEDITWILGELLKAAPTFDLSPPSSIPQKRRSPNDETTDLNRSERPRRPPQK